MKRLFLLICIVIYIFPTVCLAQWSSSSSTIFTTDKSVGIGTNYIPSWSLLQINGAGGISSTGTGAEIRFANRNTPTPGYSYAWQEDWTWYALDNVARFSKGGVGDLMTISAAGSVGIGTTSPLPSYTRFQVNGAGGISTTGTGAEFRFANRNSTPGYSYAWQEDWIWYARDNMARFSKGGVGDLMTISAAGSVGIGTTSPLPSYTRFQVNGAGGISTTGTGAEFRFANRDAPTAGYSNAWQEDWAWYAVGNIARFSKGGVGDLMTISATGSVGIGTTSPGAYKLAVEGKIGAREVEVKTGSWADFVFASDYVLPPLNEVEAHIKEKQHLPGIPSEAEVKEKGYALGAMDAKLLQKIEELTLYVIDLKKEVEALKRQNKHQFRSNNRP